MKKVLITGATGLLGKSLLKKIDLENFEIIVCSRKKPNNLSTDYLWKSFNLEQPLAIDLSGVDIIFHLASSTQNYSYQTDVNGTSKLLEIAKKHQVKHFIYISIVGVDQLPVKYFKIKKKVEEVIQQAGISFTILRATQFFEFFEKEVIKYQKLPIAIVPGDILYQPIEVRLVSDKLIEIAKSKPQNKILELGGSEKILLKDALKIWLKKKSKKKVMLNIPFISFREIG